MDKPIKSKPIFYSFVLQGLQEIARKHGYNLLIHGSMNRDMDLVCVPWVDRPYDHLTLLDQFSMYLGCERNNTLPWEQHYMFSILPGWRSSYVINLNRSWDHVNRTHLEWYLDISFTPCEQDIKRILDLKIKEEINKGA